MRSIRYIPLLFIVAAVLVLSTGSPPPTPAPPGVQAELAAAFALRLQSAPETQSLTLQLFTPELDTAFTSPDGQTAVLWLALRDAAGRRLATEPGLALATQTAAGWQVLLPGDPGWDETLAALPEGMLPLEQSPAPGGTAAGIITPGAALTGYYLPYAAGTARWLEGSISHFQSIPALGYPSCAIEYCHYAYDFTDVWHFPLLASKGGTVIASNDSCSDGSPSCTNYIVLYNAGDDAYQIYLHLANGTIPDRLTADATVQRGEYLGDSDDTGYSTSQHVHFMVTNSIWMGNSGYYWGNSIDVRFADVGINNGIPRNCYEVTHFPIYDGATQCLGNDYDPGSAWFVSGNTGAYPPTGALTRPAGGITVANGSNPLMDVTAAITDDVRVTAVRMVAKINGEWVEIGPTVTQTLPNGLYDWDVNLCEIGPLNGALEVAVRAWDHEGNVSPALGPRTIQVNHACPPPTSQLNPPETFDLTAVRLSWDGAAAGAGLSSFELQWRSGSEAWNPVNSLSFPSSQKSTWFVGQPGAVTGFRLRALDDNSQPEAWPANDENEISFSMPASCAPDAAEPDDNAGQARSLPLGEAAQRNLCGAGDPDWFLIDLPRAGEYAVSTASIDGGAAVKITVYAANGLTVLASAQAPGVGQAARAPFTRPAAGSVYVKVEPVPSNLVGTDAVYGILVFEARKLYLPFVTR